MVIDELIAILGYDIEGEENLKRFNQGLETSLRRVTALAAAIAAAAAGAFAMFGKSVITTNASFEQMTATLETIEGSTEKARAAMDWVTQFAATTPYELDQVSMSFVRLRAYGLDPMDGTLRSIGDAAAAMGKDIMQGVEAIADAAQGENERLKEFGIRASVAGDQITYSWQQNGETLTRTVKKNGTEITKALTEIMDQRFAGAMERQSKTWNGMWSNMLDQWTIFQKRVGESGFFDSMKERLGGLLDYIGQLDREGKLDQWAQSISDALVTGVDAVTEIVNRIRLNFNTIRELIDENRAAWNVFKAALAGLAIFLFPVWSAIALAAAAVDDFLTYMRDGESVIGTFIDKIQELTGVSDDVAEALGGLGAAVATALTAAFILRPGTFIKAFGRIIVAGIVALAPAIGTALATAFGLLSNPVGWAILIGGAAAGIVYLFWDEFKEAWTNINWGEFITNASFPLASMLWNLFAEEWAGMSFYEAGADAMTRIWNGLKSIAGSIKDWFAGLIPGWLAEIAPGFGAGMPTSGNDNGLNNAAGNIGAMMGGMPGKLGSTVNDNRTSNQTNNVTINQNVTQPTQAPAAAATATGNAVTRSLDPARMNGGGGF
ncbi:hypothetical protein JET14_13235 [Martelella lutilitoris]|uniref:Tape measure protein N-terminal domain-containing protein n=1 Tax=Martelella lutilitoris TaxID=2583532 RepID=A0A7T7HHK6_9HYPH|nr:tape measure protein [Martelella lutilitoris]QQM29290.1 hypothetical protein JET14_13235 [Martelella lutilitoris]